MQRATTQPLSCSISVLRPAATSCCMEDQLAAFAAAQLDTNWRSSSCESAAAGAVKAASAAISAQTASAIARPSARASASPLRTSHSAVRGFKTALAANFSHSRRCVCSESSGRAPRPQDAKTRTAVPACPGMRSPIPTSGPLPRSTPPRRSGPTQHWPLPA
eukprot:scaffold3201_cov116-Isochrysis_galbana.AAC.5